MSVTLHCKAAHRHCPSCSLSSQTAPAFLERTFSSLLGVQSWNPTNTAHTNTSAQHLPFTDALLSHLSPVLSPFPGDACSTVKAAETHSHKHCDSYGRQEKWAPFHNSSSPLCTTLLYWPIFYCQLQQSKLKQHRQNCAGINLKNLGFKGLGLNHHNFWVS